MAATNPFGAESVLKTSGGEFKYFSLPKLAAKGFGQIDTLPFSMRVLLEACLRNVDGFVVTEEHVAQVANWNATKPNSVEVPFMWDGGSSGFHRGAGCR